MFNEEDLVEITRKIHGTSARYGIVRKKNLSIWDKVKRFFGNEWVEYEYVYGSHNVEKGSGSQGFIIKHSLYTPLSFILLTHNCLFSICFYFLYFHLNPHDDLLKSLQAYVISHDGSFS